MRTWQSALLAATLVITVGFLLYRGNARTAGMQSHADSGHTLVGDTSDSSSTVMTDVATSQPEYVLKPWRSLRGHMHNKTIHVPIGFGLAAFFLSLVARRRKEIEPGIRWLVLVAAIGSVAAYATGTNQATLLEGGSKDWVIELHEWLGMATAASLWAWAAMFWVQPLKRWAFWAGIVATALIFVTGFFGGVLAHG